MTSAFALFVGLKLLSFLFGELEGESERPGTSCRRSCLRVRRLLWHALCKGADRVVS